MCAYGKVCKAVSVVGAYPRGVGHSAMFCALLIFAGIGVNRLARGTPNTHCVRIGEPSPSDNGSTPEASSKDIRCSFFFCAPFLFRKKEKSEKTSFLFLPLPVQGRCRTCGCDRGLPPCAHYIALFFFAKKKRSTKEKTATYIFAARLRCASVVATRQPVHTNPGED